MDININNIMMKKSYDKENKIKEIRSKKEKNIGMTGNFNLAWSCMISNVFKKKKTGLTWLFHFFSFLY